MKPQQFRHSRNTVEIGLESPSEAVTEPVPPAEKVWFGSSPVALIFASDSHVSRGSWLFGLVITKAAEVNPVCSLSQAVLLKGGGLSPLWKMHIILKQSIWIRGDYPQLLADDCASSLHHLQCQEWSINHQPFPGGTILFYLLSIMVYLSAAD